MASHQSFLALVLLSSLSLASASASADAPSAYEMLERFDFPKGILPEGVESYRLSRDGSFEVFFGSDCEFKIDAGYSLKYKKKITGRVESGLLKELRGISVKVLLLWLSIGEVVKSDGELYFYVGPLSASFPASNFEECPRCHCGFDCVANLVSDS